MELEDSVQKNVAAPETGRSRRFSFRNLIVLAAVAAVSTVSIIYFLQQAADITGPVDITVHGWIALSIGVLFSLVIGIGLMALVFFSSRHGYDERVRDFDKD